MLCIDWKIEDVPITIMGDEGEDDYQRMEAILVPCNYKHTMFGYEGDSIHSECEPNL